MENPIRAALQLYIHISVHMHSVGSPEIALMWVRKTEREKPRQNQMALIHVKGPTECRGPPPDPATTGLVQV